MPPGDLSVGSTGEGAKASQSKKKKRKRILLPESDREEESCDACEGDDPELSTGELQAALDAALTHKQVRIITCGNKGGVLEGLYKAKDRDNMKEYTYRGSCRHGSRNLLKSLPGLVAVMVCLGKGEGEVVSVFVASSQYHRWKACQKQSNVFRTEWGWTDNYRDLRYIAHRMHCRMVLRDRVRVRSEQGARSASETECRDILAAMGEGDAAVEQDRDVVKMIQRKIKQALEN